MEKISQLCDIAAPREEVFHTAVNIDKRTQLSPLWGLSCLVEVSADYPAAGSRYRIRVLPGAPFGLSQGTLNTTHIGLAMLAEFLMLKLGQQIDASTTEGTPAPQPTKEGADLPVEYNYIVLEYQPVEKFIYQLDNEARTVVTWSFKCIPSGTRVVYEERFSIPTPVGENYLPTINKVVSEWLTNIKRYCELRGSTGRRLIKWFLDRFYLKMRPDQRRTVLLLLMMQAIGLVMFLLVVIIWGLPHLLF